MECFETITATGSGYWSAVYTLELFTLTRVYHSRQDQSKREIVTYGFRYKPPSVATWEENSLRDSERIFESETARTTFLNQSFTDLRIDPAPTPFAVKPCRFDLSPVAGQRVYSVTFLADSFQITIDEHFFEFALWPTVHIGNRSYSKNAEGYCDALCSLIGKTVSHIEEYFDAGLVFDFEDGSVLECPLRDSGNIGFPEIAEYRYQNGTGFIWLLGEPPYD